jgi:transposase
VYKNVDTVHIKIKRKFNVLRRKSILKPPLEGLDREQLNKLDKEMLIEILLNALSRIGELEKQVAAQTATIQKLSDEIAKNSSNSSKPPSSDGLKKPKTGSLRQKGQRPIGGQPGHQGNSLKMVDEPDYTELHSITNCPHCQTDLSDTKPSGYEKRQLFDLPPVCLEVTEHQAEVKQCPSCGQQAKGTFSSHVTQPTQYEPRLKAQASYLNNYHFIPLERTEELLTDFYGQSPSEGAVITANNQLVTQIDPTLEIVREQLIASDVTHFDESGMRVAGNLHWLHVASTPQLTHYHVHRKRGQEGMAAGEILPQFQGKAVPDHWLPYAKFEDCEHTFCNAHHLRELQFVAEQYQQTWATQMGQLLLSIKAEVAATPEPETRLPEERLAHYEALYDKLIADGLTVNPLPDTPSPKKRGRPKQSPPQNLLERLAQHKSGVLAFMYDFHVPFDNNLAERDVRMVKVKQKVSGTFRTHSGADTFCAIRFYISTVRKHGYNVIDAMYDAFIGQPFIPSEEMA